MGDRLKFVSCDVGVAATVKSGCPEQKGHSVIRLRCHDISGTGCGEEIHEGGLAEVDCGSWSGVPKGQDEFLPVLAPHPWGPLGASGPGQMGAQGGFIGLCGGALRHTFKLDRRTSQSHTILVNPQK